MSRYQITVTKPEFHFTLNASPDDRDDTKLEAMLAAMREGLEANGYGVDIEAHYTKALKI